LNITLVDLQVAIGIVFTIVGGFSFLLGLWMRYLIGQHILNCPYPARFEKALENLTKRVVADGEKVDRHLETPGRHST